MRLRRRRVARPRDPRLRTPSPSEPDLLPPQWVRRRELTLELAEDSSAGIASGPRAFEPVGVAQGWSPDSYADSVAALQRLGYERIALGGLVAQKTHEILAVLAEIGKIREPGTGLHLLGVTRCEQIPAFASFGVTSFDSTSPFRQAFKDDRDNYYDGRSRVVALRVPRSRATRSSSGASGRARSTARRRRRLEQHALRTLAAFDRGDASVDAAAAALREYEMLHDETRDRSRQYREVLEAAPWKRCDCEVCRDAGIQVIIFRGTERNKRRGFHNLHVFARRFAGELQPEESLTTAGAL